MAAASHRRASILSHSRRLPHRGKGLFLSKKTVETHIRNMFRKLDANSLSTSLARWKPPSAASAEPRCSVTATRATVVPRAYTAAHQVHCPAIADKPLRPARVGVTSRRVVVLGQ